MANNSCLYSSNGSLCIASPLKRSAWASLSPLFGQPNVQVRRIRPAFCDMAGNSSTAPSPNCPIEYLYAFPLIANEVASSYSGDLVDFVPVRAGKILGAMDGPAA